MGFLPGGFPAGAGGMASPAATTSYAFAGSALNTTGNQSSISESIAWGDAPVSGTRHLIVGVGSVGTAGSNAHSSVSVGGTAATLVKDGTSSTRAYSLWIVEVPTGTSGTVTVTATDIDAALIAVWAAYNLQSTTPTATARDDDATAGSSDLSLNVLDGGAVFFIGTRSGGVAGLVATGVTQDVEQTSGTGFLSWAASALSVSAGSPRAVTVTTSGGFQIQSVAASFR